MESVFLEKDSPAIDLENSRIKVAENDMVAFGVYFLDHSDWKYPFSPSEFQTEFSLTYSSLENKYFFAPYSVEYYEGFLEFEDIALALASDAYEQTLGSVIAEFLEHMILSHEIAMKSLYSKVEPDALVEYFSFP